MIAILRMLATKMLMIMISRNQKSKSNNNDCHMIMILMVIRYCSQYKILWDQLGLP